MTARGAGWQCGRLCYGALNKRDRMVKDKKSVTLFLDIPFLNNCQWLNYIITKSSPKLLSHMSPLT